MYGETCPSGGSCVCAHAVGEFDSCQARKNCSYYRDLGKYLLIYIQGDIGGPLIYQNGDRPELYGVYSGGYDCASPRFPGVYTNVFRKYGILSRFGSVSLTTWHFFDRG